MVNNNKAWEGNMKSLLSKNWPFNEHYIHQRIELVAIQNNGLTISQQLGDASLVDVEKKITDWNSDRFYKGVNRAFATIEASWGYTIIEMAIGHHGVQVLGISNNDK